MSPRFASGLCLARSLIGAIRTGAILSGMILIGAIATCAESVAAPVQTEHVRVALISEKNARVPGQRAWLGLRLVHEPHWHTYWINPGDSGLPTKLAWHLPAYLQADEIAWPTPQRFDVGTLSNFGYSGKALLPVALEVAPTAKRGSIAHVSVDAKWLVCREQCIPGKATLKLSLPIAATAVTHSRWQHVFAAARAAQPLPSAWSGSARLAGDRIEVALSGADLPSTDQLDAFVVQRQVVGYERPRARRDGDSVTFDFARSEYFSAPPAALDLLIVDGGRAGEAARSVTVPFAGAEAGSPRH